MSYINTQGYIGATSAPTDLETLGGVIVDPSQAHDSKYTQSTAVNATSAETTVTVEQVTNVVSFIQVVNVMAANRIVTLPNADAVPAGTTIPVRWSNNNQGYSTTILMTTDKDAHAVVPKVGGVGGRFVCTGWSEGSSLVLASNGIQWFATGQDGVTVYPTANP